MKERSQAERNDFYKAMQPRWDDVATLLAADRPPAWEGYRFEASIECENPATPRQFSIKVEFGDRVSNRVRGGVPQHIVDKLADLRMDYLDFSTMDAWRTVVIEQIWNAETRSWGRETKWTF